MLEAIYPLQNRARPPPPPVIFRRRFPFLTRPPPGYEPLNVPVLPDLAIVRCAVLLAAGLAGDALAEADGMTARSSGSTAGPPRRPNCCWSRPTARWPRRNRRPPWTGRRAAYRMYQVAAQRLVAGQRPLVLVQAEVRGGPVSAPGCFARRTGWPSRLDELSSSDAPQAHLLAGRVALDLAERDVADRHLIEAAQSRRRGPAMSRASGWLAEALRAEAAGHPRRLLAVCRRGLGVLDEYRFSLGASELRAQATAHGAELAVLAQRHAVVSTVRGCCWPGASAGGPPHWPYLSAALRRRRAQLKAAAFRKATVQLEEASTPGQAEREAPVGTAAAGGGRQRVRAAGPRWHGPGPAMSASPDLLDQLGTAQLIESSTSTAPLRAGLRGGSGPAVHRGPRRCVRAAASRGSRCAGWPAAGRETTWTARWPCWRRPDRGCRTPCSAQRSDIWATAR